MKKLVTLMIAGALVALPCTTHLNAAPAAPRAPPPAR